jgi:hypothetical protein
MIQDEIYGYFERNPWLKELFIFNDEFVAEELTSIAAWREGYRYVEFGGNWFTVKYRLDHEWADDKVILYFRQASPLQVKSLQADFALMDLLVANMEYHHQDYAAYMQQHGLLGGENQWQQGARRPHPTQARRARLEGDCLNEIQNIHEFIIDID